VRATQPVIMTTTNEDEDTEEEKEKPQKRARLDGTKKQPHEAEWYSTRILVYAEDGKFVGYRAHGPQDSNHPEPEGKAGNNPRAGSVLGLLHEDKNNHEMAMDLLLRLLGPDLSHGLAWKTIKSVTALSDGMDTRKLQDHLQWLTEALFFERSREFLLCEGKCEKTACKQARSCASPAKRVRNDLSTRKWWGPYRCLLRLRSRLSTPCVAPSSVKWRSKVQMSAVSTSRRACS